MVRCRGGKVDVNHVLRRVRPVSRVATFGVTRIPEITGSGELENYVVDVVR